ncbi:MAG: hypothetical protein ACI9KE_005507, partial [Polyangiales bacterium]
MRFSVLLSFALLFSAACKSEDACARVTCPTGTACQDGLCLEILCSDDTCGAGSVCDPTNGQCYCGDDVCSAANICTDDAECMPALCTDVTCAGDAACSESDGLCYCGEATCGAGEICEADACASNLPEAVCPGGAWESGQSAFRERTSEWGLDGVMGVRLNVADFDGDGSPDLLVRRGGQAMDDFGPEGVRRTWVLRNNGGGFEDVSQASGMLATRESSDDAVGRPVEIAAFADVDNDGDLDAFLATNTVDAEATAGERSEVLLNQGDGTFVLGPLGDHRSPDRFDVPAGASFVDFDLDGNIDLFVPQHNFSNGGTFFLEDRLYRGDGTGAFVQVTEEAGLVTAGWDAIADLNAGLAHSRAWGSLARDLDGDGYTELI